MNIEIAKSAVLCNELKFNMAFYDWLLDNWHVFEYFEMAATRTWDAGFRHYSARTIVEVMRHRSNIREIGDKPWKINNDIVPEMARLYMILHPDQDGFFEFRERAVTL